LRRPSLVLPLLVLGLVPAIHAQSSYQLPGCEVNPQVQNVIDRDLSPTLLDRMTFADRLAFERETLERLIAQYPRELEPYTRLRDLLHQYAPDQYPKLQNEWIRMEQKNPDDPLALLLAGEALDGKNTPESIRLLKEARATAPGFPWPARDLAGVYSDTKFADAAEAKENIDAFYALCPTSPDGSAQILITKADPSLLPKVTAARAVALRRRLEKEADPKELLGYRTLWTLEFRTRKPQEYAAERRQIAADLARMEKIEPRGDAEWQALLISGYKQSGAPEWKIERLEDRLIAKYPHSREAYEIVSDRWDKAHPEPRDQGDTAAWNTYRKAYERALQGWIRDYPDVIYLHRKAWFFLVVEDDDTIPKKSALMAVNAFLHAVDVYDGPTWQWAYYPPAAQLLVERGWEPDRAISLLKEAKANYVSDWIRAAKIDNTSDRELSRRLEYERQQKQYLDGLMLKAAIEAHKPEIAAELRPEVDAPPPAERKLMESYWTDRARLALLTGKKLDSLAYYQMALRTRLQAPKPYEGRLHDDLADEAHAVWKQEGGTETAWATWRRMPAARKAALGSGRWEKPKQSIPPFELTDLSGNIWRLKDLNGKSVLIDVWATWCGPCQAELPDLQKLYNQVKNRKDIQILTFDDDSNPGVLAAYLKRKGYTFPVLPIADAAGIQNAVDDNGIPQNWILDGSGRSDWRQIGYMPETYADFSRDMLTRLGSVPAQK